MTSVSTSTSFLFARPAQNMAPKGRSGGQTTGPPPPKRGERRLVVKKKTPVVKGKPPNPGERKAMRKRIVLSNTNALEVKGMQDLSEENMVDMKLRGQVLGLPGTLETSTDSVVDQLRAVEAFKTTQGWGLFRRPGMLVRKESVELGRLLSGIGGDGEKKTVRRVYTGERVNGKSMMLLQAMAMAFMKRWIVIGIPETHDLTMGNTDYAPLPKTNPTQYVQNTYLSNLLSRTVRANRSLLSKLSLSQKHNLSFPLQSNISLDRLADLGVRDPDIAWPIFQTLWKELTTPSNDKIQRPPILLTIDGLGHIMRNSAYRDTNFKHIHAHDLTLINHLITYLSGTQTLPNGGAILAATSGSNPSSAPTLSLALARAEAQISGKEIPPFLPYEKYDERVLDSLRGVEVIRLEGLSREETRGLMEYYANSGVLRQLVDERFVAEKWTLAGGGIVGELERGTVRMRV
ncbi:MAG: hypothetical protein M1812_005755 [Candelaria pacifica]|nr:MAG: hypothetical protein M1812_005755 [Candelaria pacifica]